MEEIDARGLSCPQPVLMLAKAIKGSEQEIVVLVDDFAAIENCTRYAENHKYIVCRKEKDGYTALLITSQDSIS